MIARFEGDALSLFPEAFRSKEQGVEAEMKTLKQLILGSVMVVGLAISAAAQKDDQKKPPPKEGRPPKVEPAPEKPPPRNPREGEKPKKPELEVGKLFINKNDLAG